MRPDTAAQPGAEEDGIPAASNTVSGQHETLRECVHRALKNYFEQLEGEEVTNLYQMVLAEVEAPLLEAVMEHTRSNQTLASHMLGLNRGTLRKKLKLHGML